MTGGIKPLFVPINQRTIEAYGYTIVNAARDIAIARKTTLASNLGQAKIEAMKALNYNALTNSQENNIDEQGRAGGNFNRVVTVTAGPIPNTKLITVTINWTDFIKTHTVSVRTMITNI